MGYNYQDTASITTANENPLYIFSSATDSSYTPAPDYRDLTVSGAWQTYHDLTVSDGGFVRVGMSAAWNGGTVSSGGSVVVSARAKLYDVTISSGGVISGMNTNAARTATTLFDHVTVSSSGELILNAQWAELNEVTVAEGGKLTFNGSATNIVLAGANTNIAAGTVYTTDGLTALEVKDGVVTGHQNFRAILYISNGITIDGGTNNRWLYVCDGAVLKDFTVGTGNVAVSNGGIASNVTAGATNYLYVSQGGIVRGVTVVAYTAANGYVTVDKGIVSGAHVQANGRVFFKGGLLHNAKTDTGAKVYIYGSGGNTSLGGADTAITQGTVIYYNGTNTTGAVTDTELAVADGKITGLVMKNSGLAGMNNLTVLSGLSAIAPTLSSGTLLYVSNGAEVRGGVVSEGKIFVSNGGYISGVLVSAGSAELYDAATMTGVERDAIRVEDMSISAGRMILRGTNVSGKDLTVRGGNLFIQNGADVDGIYASGGVTSMYFINNTVVVDYDALNVTAKNVNVYAGAKFSATALTGRNAEITGMNAEAGATVFLSSATLNLVDGNVVNGLTNSKSWIYVSQGAQLLDAQTVGGGNVHARGGLISGFVQSAGNIHVSNGGVVRNVTAMTGNVNVKNGGAVYDAVITGGQLEAYDDVSMTGVERDAITVSGVEVYAGRANLRGTNVSGSNVTLYDGLAIVVNGATLDGLVVSGGEARVDFYSATTLVDYNTYGGTARNVEVFDGILQVAGSGASASGVVMHSGYLYMGSGAAVTGAVASSDVSMTLKKGGAIAFDSVASGAIIDITFEDDTGAHGNTDAIISGWNNLAAGVEVNVRSIETGYDYVIADTANADITLDCGDYRIFDETVKSGEQHSNAFLGRNLDFSDGVTLKISSFAVGTQTIAAELDNQNATVLADGGLATKWDANTDVSVIPAAVAGGNTTGDAWLTVDGADLATALYGAEGNFAHNVNLWLYEGTVRNLAAGATAGGSVKNVNLLVSDNGENGMNFTGVAYAGGFGNVTGEVKAELYGGTFAKDFYAGALANKLDSVTNVGNVSMTIDGGTFSGNIYGASAVKTVAGKNGTRHTAGDVTLTVTGGSTTKGTQACVFAGGYATGDATGTVYTVDSVTATISGGSWGTAAGGRGIFGGIMASGVTAQAGDVNLTVSGGSMGNVYGGGWAQKTGAQSIVGDVTLTISGGTIANVFGGGSHSSSGGTTETGDVTITVSGGNITGDIYARGQLDGDTTGAASVIFAGANDFDCGVFGYSYVGGAGEGAALSFAGYTGTFSGNVGGFDDVTFADGTAMTLSTESDNVSNGKWMFDLTDRADALAGTSLLVWDNADFAGDSVKVSFADDAQAQGGWNIATVAEAFSGTTFDVEIGGAEIASGLAYGGQIASGDYQGWGFTLDDGALKFKNLA